MQAIILAAGQSSRFYPFSDGIHKTMICLLGKPILAHTIEGMREAGIRDIVMVVRDDKQVEKYFGDGKKFGVGIVYVVQDEPLGMGDALLRAKKYIKGDFIFMGGNHVNSEVLIDQLLKVKDKKRNLAGVVMAKKRENTWDYGVATIKNGFLSSVVEKPRRGEEPSKLCLVSLYHLPVKFLEILKNINKVQYNFEEALDSFAKHEKIAVIITEDEILTLKYPWDLLKTKSFLLERVKKYIGKNVEISKSAKILGEVLIEDGVKIMEGARIKGPCYIGKNVVIGNNALLRNSVDVEEEAVVGAYMELKNSLIMRGGTTHSGFIGDSIIGENCKIGAQFCSGNVRLNREIVKAVVKNDKIDTGLLYLGVTMGKDVRVGIKASTMPGVIIGENAIIGPSTTVLHNVPADTRYYTKFQEIIEEKK